MPPHTVLLQSNRLKQADSIVQYIYQDLVVMTTCKLNEPCTKQSGPPASFAAYPCTLDP